MSSEGERQDDVCHMDSTLHETDSHGYKAGMSAESFALHASCGGTRRTSYAEAYIKNYNYLRYATYSKTNLGIDLEDNIQVISPLGNDIVNYYLKLSNDALKWLRAAKLASRQENMTLYPLDIFTCFADGHIELSQAAWEMEKKKHPLRNTLKASVQTVKILETTNISMNDRRFLVDFVHKGTPSSINRAYSTKINHVRRSLVIFFTQLDLWTRQGDERRRCLHSGTHDLHYESDAMDGSTNKGTSTDRSMNIPRAGRAQHGPGTQQLRAMNAPDPKRQLMRRGTFRDDTSEGSMAKMADPSHHASVPTLAAAPSVTPAHFSPQETNSDLESHNSRHIQFNLNHFPEGQCPVASEKVINQIQVLYRKMQAESEALKLFEDFLANKHSHQNRGQNRQEHRSSTYELNRKAIKICPGIAVASEMPLIKSFNASAGGIGRPERGGSPKGRGGSTLHEPDKSPKTRRKSNYQQFVNPSSMVSSMEGGDLDHSLDYEIPAHARAGVIACAANKKGYFLPAEQFNRDQGASSSSEWCDVPLHAFLHEDQIIEMEERKEAMTRIDYTDHYVSSDSKVWDMSLEMRASIENNPAYKSSKYIRSETVNRPLDYY